MFFPVLVAITLFLYLWLAWRQNRTAHDWSWKRTASFCAGSVLLLWGLFPRVLPFPEGDFRRHMAEHLLIAMLAPIGLVMAAPITLLLRSVPTRVGRTISRFMHTRALQFLTNPITALILNLGGMAALYFTPLYREMMGSPAIQYLVHFHLITAGCLYTWVIAGPDPAPNRPSVPVRLVVLGIAVIIHSVLSQLLYAGIFVDIPAPSEQLKGGAELMYYGGDVAEMLLAFALVTTWHPVRKRNSVIAPTAPL